jgi:hypothetical protein
MLVCGFVRDDKDGHCEKGYILLLMLLSAKKTPQFKHKLLILLKSFTFRTSLNNKGIKALI